MLWHNTTTQARPRAVDLSELAPTPHRTGRLKAAHRARAAVLLEPKRFVVQELELPALDPSHVRVRLEGCGVCASNFEPWDGRPWFQYPLPPGNPGHEGWGVVQAVGHDVAGVREGDRVTMLAERAYATHVDVPASKVVVLPASLDGRLVPGEPLACAWNVLARCGLEPGQRVAIVGIGFMGAVLTALCRQAGAEVIAISRRRSTLATAARMGAHACVAMDDHHGVIRQVEALTGGALCDCVIECAGAQWPLDLASALTRVRGRLVIAGYHQDGPRQIDMQLWNWRGFDVVNAHERDDAVTMASMRRAVAALAEGRLDPFELLTHAFALDELDAAFEVMSRRPEGFVKAVVCHD
jgi:threonine dehydrogenase-like Zn-dependent dehydrogenase